MNTHLNPQTLAFDLLPRSICRVQMSAVLIDSHGIFSWGWNSSGSGYGIHAECHAIERANRNRLAGSTIIVSGIRRKSQNLVLSLPCDNCMERIIKARIGQIQFHGKDGKWQMINL